MKSIKTTLIVVLLVLAAALFAGPAFTSNQGGEGRPIKVVDIGPGTDPATQVAVQACAGLFNRKYGGSVYTRMTEKDDEWIEELGLKPIEKIGAATFLASCQTEFTSCVRYSYDDQRTLLPNIITVSAVLGAVPVDKAMDAKCGNVAFDATAEFKDRATPYLATKYVYENYLNDTTGLGMINPGYTGAEGKVWDPAIVMDVDARMIDYAFSQKLFVMYLVNGCIKHTKEHELLNRIVTENPWQKPIGVYGYASYWNVFGGYLFESQTGCSDARNMGAIPTTVNNLSFFSTRREPITEPGQLKQNELEAIDYDPTKTYVAFIVGDGDNIAFMLGFRTGWFKERVEACGEGGDSCPPLTWSMSPHLPRIAPDVIQWYYGLARETGKDYFMLPPSGHFYAMPSSMEKTTIQDEFAAATEKDALLLGTASVVHWDWFNNWRYAENVFLPKYATQGSSIKGIFPLNVPYLFPTMTWKHNQFFKVLEGQDGGRVMLFRPRPWRGINDIGERLDRKFYLSPGNMAKEISAYPRGTVTAIYMTSDGGLTLQNSFLQIIKLLPDHVRLVSCDTAVKLAFAASERSGKK